MARRLIGVKNLAAQFAKNAANKRFANRN